ncbi:MAG: hypothetical protein WDO16_04045 [Bacteroidota bacterium]
MVIGFLYHTSIGWLVFAIAIFSSILIAWITVGYKAIKQRWPTR